MFAIYTGSRNPIPVVSDGTRRKSDPATFKRYNLGNANINGTVSFKFHNSKSFD